LKQKKYELIIFDWDGTIIDSQAHIIDCMQRALLDEGLQLVSEQEIRHIIGLSLDVAIAELYPGINDAVINRVADGYRYHFFSDPAGTSKLFAGVDDVIKDLHAEGYYIAVATGKGRRGLDMALHETKLEPYFHITRCADETRSKPDPLMLDEILTDLDMNAAKALMVGDTSYDMQMGNNIKMDTCAVTYGMHERDHLEDCSPTFLIDSIDQLSFHL